MRGRSLLCGCLLWFSGHGLAEPFTFTHKNLWFVDNQLTNSAVELVSLLADLGYLDSAELSADQLAQQDKTATLLTKALIEISAVAINHQLLQPALSEEQIQQAFWEQRLAALIDAQLPKFAQVSQLRQHIARMRTLSYQPWPKLDPQFMPRLGQRHKEVNKLVFMLRQLGDFTSSYQPAYYDFSPAVVTALKRFQRRHQLVASGKIDAATRTMLTRSPAQRLRLLQLNLQRWLSLPSHPPAHYIMVNIPAYRLSYHHHQREQLSMPVIVGHPTTPTPIMLTQIDSVTANPVWRPPASIINKELQRQLTDYPLRLSSQRFYWRSRTNRDDVMPLNQRTLPLAQQLRDYRLEQGPGEANALGRWRFNIANNQAIYLHDTPVKHLFDHSQRALSHGCIRLLEADKLAETLLSSFAQRPVSATRTVKLPAPLAVYINYQTVRAERDQLVWYPDIYQLDATQLGTSFTQAMDKKRI
ncbi:L,D-transpeptidase family protein [Alteromonas ponticola]|uniref:L,D-transpeptidase family protein n=1 Tax=Alteromonas aquimaris TaxID=2998417 RepID=A0ABT3PA14_9ALTE|nr:L,D-transpeptidase family protein [Alteromonas aquimaris]MCW8109365.1 L,D-transpeptidase family protein [Alteromonas aquimaris]